MELRSSVIAKIAALGARLLEDCGARVSAARVLEAEDAGETLAPRNGGTGRSWRVCVIDAHRVRLIASARGSAAFRCVRG